MQEEPSIHWTDEWIRFGFENSFTICLGGVAVLGALYAYRNWKYNRPVLSRERLWHRLARWWNGLWH